MSLYVLDSSVAVMWALPEIGAAKALAFRDDVRNKIHEIIAPDVFPSEVAHALTSSGDAALFKNGKNQSCLNFSKECS